MLLLAIVSLLGCERPRKSIIGTWTVDVVALANSKELLKIAPPAGILARDWKVNMVRDWVFRFNRDKSLEMRYQGHHYQGRYKVTSEVGNTLYLRTEMRPLASNGLDALLEINASSAKVKVERFSMTFNPQGAILSLNDFTPIKLRKNPTPI